MRKEGEPGTSILVGLIRGAARFTLLISVAQCPTVAASAQPGVQGLTQQKEDKGSRVAGRKGETPATDSRAPASAGDDSIPTVSADYVIGPEDVLEIDVFNVPELTKTVRVANDGTISLLLLGRAQAAGLTSTELSKGLESRYGKTYVQDPHVSVFIREYHAHPVSVIGAVERPGLYQLTGSRTLIQMLSTAGGLAKRSSAPAGRTVLVTRKGGFGVMPEVEGMRQLAPDKLEIDLKKLLNEQVSGLNIVIQPEDIIGVPKADIVYVIGRGVQKPGGFVLEDREDVTVLEVLAMAEGLSANAAKHDARIIRRKADGSRTEIPLDLDKVMKGRSADLALVANDVMFVPDSSEKAAMKRGLDAAIATISGVLIFHR